MCHGCYDTGPQSTWSHPDGHYVQMPPTTSKEPYPWKEKDGHVTILQTMVMALTTVIMIGHTVNKFNQKISFEFSVVSIITG